jgi:hypothetical protein
MPHSLMNGMTIEVLAQQLGHRRISAPIHLDVSGETYNLVFVPMGSHPVEPCISISVFVEK